MTASTGLWSVLCRMVFPRTSHRPPAVAGVGGVSDSPPSAPAPTAADPADADGIPAEAFNRLLAQVDDAFDRPQALATSLWVPGAIPLPADGCARCGIAGHTVGQCSYRACSRCALPVFDEPHTFRSPTGAVEQLCGACCPICDPAALTSPPPPLEISR